MKCFKNKFGNPTEATRIWDVGLLFSIRWYQLKAVGMKDFGVGWWFSCDFFGKGSITFSCHGSLLCFIFISSMFFPIFSVNFFLSLSLSDAQ